MRQENTFLLKRWKDREEDNWHFSVKDIHSGEVKFFISSRPLTAFLQKPLRSEVAESEDETTLS